MKLIYCGIFQYKQRTKIEHNKPGLILSEKKEKICYKVDAVCQSDLRIERKGKLWKNELTKVHCSG